MRIVATSNTFWAPSGETGGGSVCAINSTSADPNPAADLSIALPIGAFLGDARIVHGRLHIPRRIDRPSGDGMLPCGGLLPVYRPDLPSEFGVLGAVDRRWHPGPAIDLHLNSLDGTPPGGPHDVV